MMISLAIKVLIPVVAFFSSVILVDEGKKVNWPFLNSLNEPIRVPITLVQLPIIGERLLSLSRINHTKAIALFFIAFWLAYAAIFMIAFAILMKIFGPSYYGKYDAPGSTNKQK